MKTFRWGAPKNEQLKLDRGVSFEQMVVAIEAGGILDVLSHPNPTKYPRQKVLVVASRRLRLLGAVRRRGRSLLPQDSHPEPEGDA